MFSLNYRLQNFMISMFTRRQKLFLLLLPVLLTFLFGIFGSDYSDQGFVRGFSWRLRLGEVPYIDFIYPRPPLTIYLDAFFKILSPSTLEVFTERLRFYFQCLLVVMLVFSKVKFQDERNRFPFLITTYFFTLGSFPPMSWYTIDGIFFSALGFYFIEEKNWKFGLSIFFAFCAAFTKQSFYPLPLFVGLYYLFQVRSLGLKPLVIGILPLTLLVAFLYQSGGLGHFILQTSGASRLEDIVKAGFLLYLTPTTFRYLAFFGIAYYLYKKNPRWSLSFLTLVFGYEYFRFIWPAIITDQSRPAKDLPRALFVLSFLFLVLNIKKDGFFRYWYLLCVAWCTSLSWGYQTPVLFISGLFVISYQIVWVYMPKLLQRRNVQVLFAASLVLVVVQNLNRHYQGKIWENRFHLGQLDSKYTLIFTNKETFEVLKTMKILAEESRSTFLPAFSDSDYFLSQKPYLSLNWISDVEVRGEQERVRSKILSCDSRIYLYRPDFNSKSYSFVSDLFKAPDGQKFMFEEYCLR